MKKIISFLLVSCIMLTSLCGSAFAEEITAANAVNTEISTMNLYTQKIVTTLTGSGTSSIKYACSVTGKSNATSIKVYLYLQEYKNGSWTSVDSIVKTVSGRYFSVSDTYSSAVKGRSYRTKAYVYVYCGSQFEYLTANSSTLIKG